MALTAAVELDCRTTGSDTNGGGFEAGASGTDWSQQDAAQYGVADGVANGTTTLTSASANFGTDVVGNLIYVQGGTGAITAGWYRITARGSATSITVDRSTGLTAGTGVTLNIGGALATIQKTIDLISVAGMTGHVKAGAWSLGTDLAGLAIGSTTVRTKLVGYTNTHGDGGIVTLTATAGITMLTVGQLGWMFDGFIFDGDSIAGTNGINHSVGGSSGGADYRNLVLKNMAGYGFDQPTNSSLQEIRMWRVEVTGCGGTAGVHTVLSALVMERCWVHDNTVSGLIFATASVAARAVLLDSLFTNNTGASSDGIELTGGHAVIRGCVSHGNGRDGLRVATVQRNVDLIANNIFDSNGAYGVNFTSGGSSTFVPAGMANNAYRGNGTAARVNCGEEPGAVTLTADPFTNAASDDYSLNAVAGGGAACRAAGVPGAIAGGLTTGYADIGAVQHRDPAGAAGYLTSSQSGLRSSDY